MGWNVLDTHHTYGVIPEDIEPDAAVTNLGATEPVVAKLVKAGIPVVHRGYSEDPGDVLVPTVVPDIRGWGRMAAEHFAERGLKHVAYVGRDPWSNMKMLYESFRSRASELGCECHLVQLPNVPVMKDAASRKLRDDQLRKWLHDLPKPVGILTFRDDEAASLCSACLRQGLAVPESVAILGIGNNQNECELAPVPLSSVDTSEKGRAQAVVQLLAALMRGDTPPSMLVRVPPSRVVVRTSTDMLAVKDQLVARTLRYIWENLSMNLPVDSLAAEIGVNRRKMERAFRNSLGRSISTELRRKRLERCCEMLRGTEMTVADIAAATGFTSADYLHASFKKAFNMTPQSYRARKHEKA
jgi:LacI family transcriptional regulator